MKIFEAKSAPVSVGPSAALSAISVMADSLWAELMAKRDERTEVNVV
jgi:hypothetical protein